MASEGVAEPAGATADASTSRVIALSPAVRGGVADRPGAETTSPRVFRIGTAWRERLSECGMYPEDIFRWFERVSYDAEERTEMAVRQHFFFGQYYMAMEEWSRALGEFSAALDEDPTNTRVMLGIVEANLGAKDVGAAQRTLDRILEMEPDNVAALIDKAKLLMLRSEEAKGMARVELLEKGIAAFEAAKGIEPKNLDILQALAAAYLQQQRVDKILEAFREVVAVSPKDTYSLLMLGNVLMKTGKPKEALPYFERVVEQRPGFVQGYVYLSMVLEEMGRTADAIDTMKRALVIEPRNEQLRRRFDTVLSRKMGSQGEEGVLREYEKFSGEYPYSSEIQRLFADKLAGQKRSERALEQYRRVLELDSDSVEAMIAIGQLLVADKRYDEATDMFARAMDINPERREIYDAIALSLPKQSDRAKAAEIFRRAIKLNPKVEKLYLALASVHDQAGDYQEALRVLEQGVATVGENPELLAGIGRIHQRLRSPERAAEYYSRAYKAAPSNAALFVKSIALLSGIGQSQKVDEVLSSGLVEFKDRKAEIYAMLGEALHVEGDLGRAAQAFSDAVQENPHQLVFYERLVRIYNLQKVFDKSVAVLERAREKVSETEQVDRLLGDTYLQSKDYEKGIAIFRQAADARPDSIEAQELLVRALNKAGRYEEALAVLRRTEGRVGRNERIDTARAITLYEQKRYDQAEKLFRELSQRRSKSTDDYYYYLGSIYLDQKRLDPAERAFRKAIEFNPNNDSALNALGYMFADSNQRLPEAKDLIERALEINPGAPHILDSLGWVNYRMNRLAEAREYVEKAAHLMGDDPEIYEHLGDIYAAEGDQNKAVEYWKRSLALDDKRSSVRQKLVQHTE